MEHIALYRKYRPRTFEDVLAQKHITDTIINQIESNRISHAYLFHGPRGTGKTSCAKILSRVLNCLNLQGHNPCNECENCKQILQDSFLDVIEMDAASHNGVDDVRDLIDGVRYPPSIGKKKVIIIDEAHMITKPAFNALLKTIEEPPSYVIFIFATTEVHKIPQTIISRCQRFDFKRIDGEEMLSFLQNVSEKEGINIDRNALQKIAKQAGGAMRDALGILEKTASAKYASIGEREIDELLGTGFEYAEQLLEALMNADIYKALSLSAEIYHSGKDLSLLREDLIEFLRKALLFSAGLPQNISDLKPRELQFLQRMNAERKREFFLFALNQFIESAKNKNFSNLRAEFEWTLASICTKPDLSKRGALESKLIELEEKISKLSLSAPIPTETASFLPDSGSKKPEAPVSEGLSDAYFEAMFDSLDDDFLEDYQDATKKPGEALKRQGAGKENAPARREHPAAPLKKDEMNPVLKRSEVSKAPMPRSASDVSIEGHSWDEVLALVKEKNPYAHTVICKLIPQSYENGSFRASFPEKLKALSVGFESRGLSDILKDAVRELCEVDIKINIV